MFRRADLQSVSNGARSATQHRRGRLCFRRGLFDNGFGCLSRSARHSPLSRLALCGVSSAVVTHEQCRNPAAVQSGGVLDLQQIQSGIGDSDVSFAQCHDHRFHRTSRFLLQPSQRAGDDTAIRQLLRLVVPGKVRRSSPIGNSAATARPATASIFQQQLAASLTAGSTESQSARVIMANEPLRRCRASPVMVTQCQASTPAPSANARYWNASPGRHIRVSAIVIRDKIE